MQEKSRISFGRCSQDVRYAKHTVLAAALCLGVGFAAMAQPVPGQRVGPTPADVRQAEEAREAERERELREAEARAAAAEEAAEPELEEPVIEEGPEYPVRRFRIGYAYDHAGVPEIGDLLALEVKLGRTEEEEYTLFSSAWSGDERIRVSIGELSFPAEWEPPRFTARAIETIVVGIRDGLQERGIVAMIVQPDERYLVRVNEEWRDVRPAGEYDLQLVIYTRTVDEIRTLGAGPRWSREERPRGRPSIATRINHRVHGRIRDGSPLEVAEDGEAGGVLRKDLLDDYVFRLNRHAGRRVDVAIAAGSREDTVVLDYLVTENRPWSVYFQVSNTGTKQTRRWRQRFGFVHTQLTNRDDVLSIDYITAGFDAAHAVIGSYEAPMFGAERLRARLYGTWSQFKASDVGRSEEEFSGQSWSGGGELIFNVVQRGQAFFDLFGGARWEHHRVDSPVVEAGSEPFFIPYFGVRYERYAALSSTAASLRVETSVPGVAGTDEDEIHLLGRLNVDDDWWVLKGDVQHSFYLEPLLFGRAWHAHDGERHRTLAHELALSARGQYSFDHRLIPQHQETMGGLYSVRGYPESIAAGDDAIVGTVEYRFHLPRALAPRDPGQGFFGREFRWAPEHQYGRPDWNLIFRGFFDVGRVWHTDRQTFESDDTLMGAGAGVNLILWRNLDVRVDWGVALRDVRDVESGHSRLHVVGTLLF